MNQIEQAKDLDILGVAEAFTELFKDGTEWHGACPICGGTDRFYVNTRGNFCGCRKCEKRWDTVGIYAAVKGIPQGRAAAMLLGMIPRDYEPKKREPVKKGSGSGRIDDAAWQNDALSKIARGKRMLFDQKTNDGLLYLRGRGFTDETLKAFSIGYDPAKFHPMLDLQKAAVVVPWIAGSIEAIKYRFLDVDKKHRFIQKGGGVQRVFGLQQLERNDRLIIVEGEMSAMSVWQSIRHEADVISVGSDSGHFGLDIAAGLVRDRGYTSVYCWFDELALSLRACKLFGCKAVPFYSRNHKDANDILIESGDEFLRDMFLEAFNRPDDFCFRCGGTGSEIIRRGVTTTCRGCKR